MPTILTYNINGIRAAIKKDLPKWIDSTSADIICLQEIKAKEEQFDKKVFEEFGYSSYIKSAAKPGYSGVKLNQYMLNSIVVSQKLILKEGLLD